MGFLRGIWARLTERFDPAALEASAAELTGNALVAALTFLAYVVLARVIVWLARPVMRRFGADQTTSAFTETIVRLLVLTAGAVAALAELGVNTPALVTSLGVAGLTIGFAARDALSNVVSGLFIFWDRPFVIGDLVEHETAYGRVSHINLRATRIVTPDGRMLSIPNSVLLNGRIASYTKFPHLRLSVPVSVGNAEDLGRVRSLLLDLVVDDPDFLDDPEPKVVVTALGDYNVTLELRAWLDQERKHIEKRAQLTELVFETLRAEGVDMPLETVALAPVEVVQREP